MTPSWRIRLEEPLRVTAEAGAVTGAPCLMLGSLETPCGQSVPGASAIPDRVRSLAAPSPSEDAAWIACLRQQGLAPWLDYTGCCWVRYYRFCRVRCPSSALAPLDPDVRRRLFFQRWAWLISHAHEPGAGEVPNAYLYVCRRRDYDLEILSPNTRSKIRRGLRRHDMRPITAKLLAESGYPCYADTRARNGLTPMSLSAFRRYWNGVGAITYTRIWGAFAGEELAAYFAVQINAGWADGGWLATRDSHLKNYSSNAVCFQAVRELLGGESPVQGVSFGLSSIQADSHLSTLHAYKLSLGFEPIPVVRVFEVHPLLRPLIRRPARTLLRLAQRVAPANPMVRKARGLLDFLTTGALPPLPPLGSAEAFEEPAG